MTIIDPNPTPRPNDLFTAQDASKAFADLALELRGIRKLLSDVLSKQIMDLEQLSRIEEGLSGSRINRLEQEVREAELELERAEASRRTAEERLKLKSEVKENNIDTQEKLKRIAASSYEDLEKQRRADQEAFKKDIVRGAVKYVVNGLAMGGTLAVLAFLWYLVQLYMSRGGP